MDQQTLDVLGRFLSAVVFLSFLGLVGWLLLSIRRGLGTSPNPSIAMLPSIIDKAVEYAAKYTELLDQNGKISAKGLEKLNYATDLAVEYIENMFKTAGHPIDIDEDLVKKSLQKYVWENPQLFPSKGVDNGSNIQSA